MATRVNDQVGLFAPPHVSAHEIIFANMFCWHMQLGRSSPQACVLAALKVADDAVAYRNTVRGVPASSTPAPGAVPVTAVATPVPTQRVEPPVAAAMANTIAHSLPEAVGTSVGVTATTEGVMPIANNESLTSWAARTPGAPDLLRELNERFGIKFQDDVIAMANVPGSIR